MRKFLPGAILLFIFYFILITKFVYAESSSLIVYAAASLTGPLNEIISEFEKETGYKVKKNFASSGNLARQIEQGAPADIYISASQKWMDYAQNNGTIDPETRFNPIGNKIVLISPKDIPLIDIKFDTPFSLADSFNGKFSIGDPAHVPAGKYAKQAMISLNWWDSIEPRLIRAKDVRQALLIVESGEVEVGTVFKSDAITSDKVQIIGEFPSNLHSPIIYAAAICSKPKSSLNQDFMDYLRSAKAQKIFIKYGFQKVR